MKQLSANNYVIQHKNLSLADVEYLEAIKMNELQKRLLMQNRKKFKDAILRIGTLIAYRKCNAIA